MSEQMPSAVLLAAADRIRDLAAEATKGEWLSNLHYVDSMPELYVRHPVCTAASEADARWIAALSPAVAPLLQDWLRYAAEMWDYPDQPGSDARALAFARAILGSGVDTHG